MLLTEPHGARSIGRTRSSKVAWSWSRGARSLKYHRVGGASAPRGYSAARGRDLLTHLVKSRKKITPSAREPRPHEGATGQSEVCALLKLSSKTAPQQGTARCKNSRSVRRSEWIGVVVVGRRRSRYSAGIGNTNDRCTDRGNKITAYYQRTITQKNRVWKPYLRCICSLL